MYEKLRGAKYISTLDMKNGYWNAALHPDSQYLTSFSSPWGTFSYQVLSQGLISSAAHFQHWVEGKVTVTRGGKTVGRKVSPLFFKKYGFLDYPDLVVFTLQ
eukprot:SAG31_NODE_3058_length_4735_cov_24.146894_2_plen_102_part_00